MILLFLFATFNIAWLLCSGTVRMDWCLRGQSPSCWSMNFVVLRSANFNLRQFHFGNPQPFFKSQKHFEGNDMK